MDAKRLEGVRLFSTLSKKEREQLGRWIDEIDVSEGTELTREGAFAYEFFVIEDGGAEVLRDGEHIADLGPGDFLGEMGIVGKVVRNATVTATSSSKVIVMTEQAFRSMSQSNPDIASRIRAAVEERCRALVA